MEGWKQRSERREEVTAESLLALKIEKRAVNWGMEVTSRSWKKYGNGFLPNELCQHFDFSPLRPSFRLLTSRTVRKISIVLSH